MVLFPNCKINIGLHVVAKRADGFHNLETIFYPVNLKDAVEIVEEQKKTQPVNWSHSGLKISGPVDDNLCIKAYHLLKKDFPGLPNIKMHLHKAIPMGAGLGGGSADAAFILKLLNSKFGLQLSSQQLIGYAFQLGSDCPFFIVNKPCYATGRGEILEEFALDLSAYRILLVNPGIHINTAAAFSSITPERKEYHLKDLVAMPIKEWQQNIYNDFEKPVFKAEPEVGEIKTTLLSNGAVYAAMSGSGSTVFGIFDKKNEPALKFPAHYFLKWV